jgi:hypothetical protein
MVSSRPCVFRTDISMTVRLIDRQVSNITDTTQIELREVESSGTLAAGEKALAELRKRKLIIQRFHLFLHCELSSLTVTKKGPMVHRA